MSCLDEIGDFLRRCPPLRCGCAGRPMPYLPQDDPDPTRRRRALDRARATYSWTRVGSLPGLNVADGVPHADAPTIGWYLETAKVALRIAENHVASELADQDETRRLHRRLHREVNRCGALSPGALADAVHTALGHVADDLSAMHQSQKSGPPRSIEDYDELFASIPLPPIARDYATDEVFAQLRVAGFNPLVIEGCESLPAGFPVTDEILQRATGDPSDTIADAGETGRLYLCDYGVFAGVPNGSYPSWQKYLTAPYALFVLPVGTGPRDLVPVAVQIGRDEGAYIFHPNDPDDPRGAGWEMAKYVVDSADGNYHELVSHLGQTHLVAESALVCTHRHLAPDHPLNVLLRPHFEGTVFINNQAATHLITQGNQVDEVMAATIEADQKLATDARLAFPFNDRFVQTASGRPNTFELRKVDNPDLAYPYRDDATRVWRAIHGWVRAYLRVYYPTRAAIAGDDELQSWARAMRSPDAGQLRDFGEGPDGRIETLEYLVDAVTLIVFTASAQHAAVNFPQGQIMLYPPAVPGALYHPPPKDPEDARSFSVFDLLPVMTVAQTQMQFLYLLGSVQYTRLGRYESRCGCCSRPYFVDRRVQPAAKAFETRLESVEWAIEDANLSRTLPYPFLLPSKIPQSTNI